MFFETSFEFLFRNYNKIFALFTPKFKVVLYTKIFIFFPKIFLDIKFGNLEFFWKKIGVKKANNWCKKIGVKKVNPLFSLTRNIKNIFLVLFKNTTNFSTG